MQLQAALKELQIEAHRNFPHDYWRHFKNGKRLLCHAGEEGRLGITVFDAQCVSFHIYFTHAPVSVIRATLQEVIAENS